jgi:hypothetical protein
MLTSICLKNFPIAFCKRMMVMKGILRGYGDNNNDRKMRSRNAEERV